MAQAVSVLLGGIPKPWTTEREDRIQVLTGADCVDIVVASPAALSAHLCECDRHESAGGPASATADLGAKLRLALTFSLLADPGLGLFRFLSASWSLAADLHELAERLRHGSVRAELRLEHVVVPPHHGPGRPVRPGPHYKPVIKLMEADKSP